MNELTKNTPWGLSEFVTKFTDGLEFHSTSSHGGFYVSDELLEKAPKYLQILSKNNYAKNKNWFEEDCEAPIVAMAFREIIGRELGNYPVEMLKQFYPDAYQAYLSEAK